MFCGQLVTLEADGGSREGANFRVPVPPGTLEAKLQGLSPNFPLES